MFPKATSICCDPSWLLTILIALLVLLLAHHVIKVRSYPAGPYPLPIIGNILHILYSMDGSFINLTRKWHRKYKKMFTVWLGTKHGVFICDWDLCKEALVTRKDDFNGRSSRPSLDVVLHDSMDVLYSDDSPCRDTLRKILLSAVKKYSISEKFAELVVDIVDKVAQLMIREGKPVDAEDYAYLTVHSILNSCAFGKRLLPDDPDFIRLREESEEAQRFLTKVFLCDILPLFDFLARKETENIRKFSLKYRQYFIDNIEEHKATYKTGTVRDFTDAVLAAREEAEAESKDSLQHLTEPNIVSLIIDLVGVGTHTTRTALNTVLLYITKNPDIQQQMRQEIDDNIGLRPPTHSDREHCPYSQAVLMEALRYKPTAGISKEHRAIRNTEIGGRKFLKGTSVFFHINSIHHCEEFWKEPEKFNPDRFLDSEGKLTGSRLNGYLPFGLGRRACPGEKLAIANLFLIITRLLQKYSLELEGGSTNRKPKLVLTMECSESFNLLFKRRNPCH